MQVETKMYSLFGKNGSMEEIKPVGLLPMYCKVYRYGYGMEGTEGAIISGPDQFGVYKGVNISDYNPGFFTLDKYSRAHSEKFGIGTYYDDNRDVHNEEEVKAYIVKAEIAVKKAAEAAQAKKDADNAEIAALPTLYPNLKKVSRNEPSRATAAANIRTELKTKFPGFKFSVKQSSGSAIDVNWQDGPTKEEVTKIIEKYVDSSTDHSGDYRDYNPSNFTHVFGGSTYVFARREQSEGVELLVNDLNVLRPNSRDKWENRNIIDGIFAKTSFPVSAKAKGLERTNLTCGSIEDFYKITF
jgi:hypothetical protein